MVDEETQYTVNVVNAFKSFGENNYVLNGLNIKVKSGTIYGLLGASGCGKSTLLQCILGAITVDSGSVYLKANNLKDVGYMPQDLCLENTLTLKETFEYFGSLYDMSKKNIEKRVAELNTFLQFPNMNSYIKDISGGQSRRVSLGISLLHNPKIIILDEPTVGIDPLLRHEIWTEFTKLVVQQKKTIIITTHYIEEAYQANCVGLMRNGILVEEGNPRDILIKYNTESLESAFLTLCYDQDSNKIVRSDVQLQKCTTQPNKLMKSGKKITTSRIKALLKKNTRVCARDYMLLFNMLILPIIQAFNLCAGVGVDFMGMPIAIRNEEVNFSDCHYSNINGCIFDNHNNLTMSCVVMNYLAKQSYELVDVKDRDSGEISMNNPNYMAFMYFPKNYTRELTKMVDDRKNYDDYSQVYVHFTKENILFRNQIILDVTNSINNVLQKTLNGCSSNPKSISVPVNFNTLFGKEVKTFVHSIAAIFVAMAAFYFPSIFSVSFMLSERMDGIFSRSTFAGVTILELLISMYFINIMITIIQMIGPLLIAYVLFSNPLQITIGLFVYVLIMLLLGSIGFFFGLLVAGLTPSKIGGVYVITGWSLMQFTLSGALWPVDGQPPYLRAVSKILPLYIGGKTMNDIALKGWTFAHPAIRMGIAITFAYAVLLLFVLIVLGKLKKDMWVLRK